MAAAWSDDDRPSYPSGLCETEPSVYCTQIITVQDFAAAPKHMIILQVVICPEKHRTGPRRSELSNMYHIKKSWCLRFTIPTQFLQIHWQPLSTWQELVFRYNTTAPGRSFTGPLPRKVFRVITIIMMVEISWWQTTICLPILLSEPPT